MRQSARVAWIVCALVLAVLAIGAAIAVATWSVALPPGAVPRGVVLLVAPVFAVIGAMVISRVPGNAIGHLFLYIGAAGAAQLLSEQIAFAAEVSPALTPLAPWAALSYYVIGLVAALVWAPYLTALFPAGRFASSREKLAAVTSTVAFIGMQVCAFILVERLPAPFSKHANPLARPELASFAYPVAAAAAIVYATALLVIVVGLLRRVRRSSGVERQQLKWFAYAAGITAATGTVMWFAFLIEYIVLGQAAFDEPPVELRALVIGSVLAFVILPAAVALAIFRYRLYDIDILINRTVLYVSVTAILAAAFAVLSAISQRAVESFTGQRSELVSVALVLVVALGFAPLRRRVQPYVDQLLPGRGLLTLLFTDIVGSTERVVSLGDERWRTVLEAYRAAVRNELARFGGREVDTAGDGFFATFERPAQAVRCAVALRDALHALGLDSRVGLHMGECELRGERVSGLNVIVAARIMATARANEIIVSNELRDMAATEFAFREKGIQSLKGVPGAWRLSVVAGAVV
jgi:class 3 adenylate cyclase